MNEHNGNNGLPKGWVKIDLGEVLDIKGGSQPPKKEFIYEPKDGYIRLLQIRDFGKKPHATYVPKNRVTKFCIKDDVLIARYGASLGRILTGMEGAYNVALAKVIFDKNLFLNTYLFYLLKTSIFQTPIHMISRSAQNGFAKHEISRIKIPIPPLPEQHRIVAKIEELFTQLDKGIEQLKTVRQQLKTYRQAVLKHAFEGKLTAAWREEQKDLPSAEELLEEIKAERQRQYEEQLEDWEIAMAEWEESGKVGKRPRKPNPQSELVTIQNAKIDFIEIPNNWVFVNFQAIADVSGGLAKNSKRNKIENKLPYLRVANVYANELRLKEIKEIGIEKHEEKKLLLKKGDLLIVEGNGSIEQIGRVAIWNGSINPIIHQNHLIKARPIFSEFANYILYWLLSPVGRKVIRDVSSSTSGLHTLSINKVKSFIVPLPPKKEQVQIVQAIETRLSECDYLEKTIAAALQQSEALRQSILNRAFEGRLVAQEEGDEPASILLERIKKEKQP